MLSYTHASLHYVHHVVAEFLAFLDDVHIHRTDGVGVEMVIYIVDVLTLQLVAIVVDLILDVEREVGIVVPLMTYESDVHLGEGVVGKLHHLVHVLILGSDEVFLAFETAVERAGDVETAVTDTLDFRNLTEHGTDLCLGLVRKMRIAHLVEILGNLNLHVVRDTLVFLDAGIEFHELILVGFAKKLLHHTEHALDTLGETVDFLLSLQYRDFRSLHDTTLDEAQAEVVLVGILLRTDNLAYQLLNLWDKPYQDKGVGEVERGMEGGKHEGELGCIGNEMRIALLHHVVIAYPSADQMDERTEHAEYPQHTEDVEHHVPHRRSSSLRIGGKCCHVGSYGGTDILTHYERNALIDRQYAGRTENHRNRHDGC